MKNLKLLTIETIKKFWNNNFRQLLLKKLSTGNNNTNCIGLERLVQICIVNYTYFLIGKDKIMPFMNKSLKSAHMKRRRLRTSNPTNKTDTSRIAFIKQRKYCVSLLRRTRKPLRKFR